MTLAKSEMRLTSKAVGNFFVMRKRRAAGKKWAQGTRCVETGFDYLSCIFPSQWENHQTRGGCCMICGAFGFITTARRHAPSLTEVRADKVLYASRSVASKQPGASK